MFETLHFQQRLKIIYAVFSRQHVHFFPHQCSGTSMVISYREIFSASWFGSGINYRHVAKGECEITHCQVSLGMVSTILSFRYFWLVSMIRKKEYLIKSMNTNKSIYSSHRYHFRYPSQLNSFSRLVSVTKVGPFEHAPSWVPLQKFLCIGICAQWLADCLWTDTGIA